MGVEVCSEEEVKTLDSQHYGQHVMNLSERYGINKVRGGHRGKTEYLQLLKCPFL